MRIDKLYMQKVRMDHKTAPVRAGFQLYAWFWFHTEVWLKPEDRRPYTFIMRDWIYPHMKWFLAILGVWYTGNFIWLNYNTWAPAILLTLSSWLCAHLVWGSGWIPGEQEYPTYNPDGGK